MKECLVKSSEVKSLYKDIIIELWEAFKLSIHEGIRVLLFAFRFNRGCITSSLTNLFKLFMITVCSIQNCHLRHFEVALVSLKIFSQFCVMVPDFLPLCLHLIISLSSLSQSFSSFFKCCLCRGNRISVTSLFCVF